MTCLDTDVLVSLLKGKSSAVETISNLENSEGVLFTTSITSYELVKGAYISSKQNSNLKLVKDLLSNLNILNLNEEVIYTAGKIYRDLRKKGKPIGEFDILIAAICISNNETLISNDAHFKHVDGLSTQNW